MHCFCKFCDFWFIFHIDWCLHVGSISSRTTEKELYLSSAHSKAFKRKGWKDIEYHWRSTVLEKSFALVVTIGGGSHNNNRQKTIVTCKLCSRKR